MPITLVQTDIAASCAAAACGNAALNGATSAKEAKAGGTAGTTAVSLTQDGANGVRSTIFFQSASDEPNSANWEAGSWTCRLEVTTANMNLGWGAVGGSSADAVGIGSMTPGCVCTDVWDQSLNGVDLGTTGVKTRTFTTVGNSNRSATDRIWIVYGIHNETSKTQAWAYKPSQNIDTPVNQGASAIPPGLGPGLSEQTERAMSASIWMNH